MKAGEDFIGVSTASYCHDGQGRLLLHKRSIKTRDEHGVWDVPGGRVEFGEALDEAALRELKEEFNCAGVIEARFMAYSNHREYKGKQTHWVNISFVVKVNPDEVKIMEPEKAEEIGWYSLDELPSPLHSGIKITMDRQINVLQKYIK